MLTENWKQQFSTTILNRGWEYYRQMCVDELEFDGQGITAVVSGSYEYNVDITFSGNGIGKMTCDCPYAEEGNYCKHMAAVLYAWEDEMKNPDSGHEKYGKEISVKDAVQMLTEETVRVLLLEYAEKDRGLRDHILISATGGISRKQRDSWKKELAHLKRNYDVGYDDYLNYDQAYDYFSDLVNFLHEKIPPLLQIGLFADAYSLIREIYCAAGVDCDDSCGGYEELIDECRNYLEDIIRCSDPECKQMFYRECLNRCNGMISVNNDEMWQNILLNAFAGEEYLRRTMRLIEEALNRDIDITQGNWIAWLVQHKIKLMRELGDTEEEIAAFRHQYCRFPEIRRMEWEEALERNDISNAIQLLRESKQLDADQRNLVSEYSRKLIELYEKQNDVKACRTELTEYIFELSNYKWEEIQKLKKFSSADEWRSDLQRILKLKQYPYIRHQLMASEEMYRELLNELETDRDLEGLQQYEAVLKPYFPEEIRDVFFAYLRLEMEHAMSRETYAGLIARLKKMKTYPEGEAMANSLADEWRVIYKRRSAMLDELKRAGFH